MSEEESIYYIALGLIPGIGVVNAKQLISYCGGVQSIFKKKKQHLLKIPGLGPAIVAVLKNVNFEALAARAKEEIDFCAQHDIEIINYHSNQYPKYLSHCKDAPYLLYKLGDADLNPPRMINIVGTRRATNYGKQIVQRLIRDLKDYNVTIVSGLAYGIDAYAHKFALENDLPTIAVLAHGLDIIYPAAHRSLSQSIIRQNGALLTEFRSQSKPDKQNFPSRNRIVAGMCTATVVVESAEKGGALITAEIAQGYHRDVFAFPGKVTDKYSKGCNALIKNNGATMIESSEDLIQLLGWQKITDQSTKKSIQRSLFIDLSSQEQAIYDVMDKESTNCHIDVLRQKTKLSSSQLMAALLNLELNAVISVLPGNTYRLN